MLTGIKIKIITPQFMTTYLHFPRRENTIVKLKIDLILKLMFISEDFPEAGNI